MLGFPILPPISNCNLQTPNLPLSPERADNPRIPRYPPLNKYDFARFFFESTNDYCYINNIAISVVEDDGIFFYYTTKLFFWLLLRLWRYDETHIGPAPSKKRADFEILNHLSLLGLLAKIKV